MGSDAPLAIEAPTASSKAYGEVRALDGVDLAVPAGTVLGVLGAERGGQDHRRPHPGHRPPGRRRGGPRAGDRRDARDPQVVRTRIGLAGQYAAVDGNLTGRENLSLIGALTHLPRRDIRPRAAELLERFGLADAADRPSAPTRAACGGAWTWRPRSCTGRRCCSSTSRPPASTRASRSDLWDTVQVARRRGDHGAPHHPVPRGGRPARGPDRGDRPRDRPRRGHLRGAQADASARPSWSSTMADEDDAVRAADVIEALDVGAVVRRRPEVRLSAVDGTRALVGAIRALDGAGLDPATAARARALARRRVPEPDRPPRATPRTRRPATTPERRSCDDDRCDRRRPAARALRARARRAGRGVHDLAEPAHDPPRCRSCSCSRRSSRCCSS